jgi:hypothetical protein
VKVTVAVVAIADPPILPVSVAVPTVAEDLSVCV